MKSRLFLCNGAATPPGLPADAVRGTITLNTNGPSANVNLKIEDVARAFKRDLSPRLLDFLEIAAYVYAGDASTARGAGWKDDHTFEPWDRSMHFVIAVRDVAFWQQEKVRELLRTTLAFLSNDEYLFEFVHLADTIGRQMYLDFGTSEEWPFSKVDRVLMFSGGLDSLAGAVETAAAGQNLVLVSHRSVSTLSSRQVDLSERLRKTLKVPMIHIPVWVNKDERLGREYTQRTRSFLFCALGTVIAESVSAAGVRFFENGIVSMNLPVADEVLRSRASRTTHQHALNLLSTLCALVTDRNFIIDNPFLSKTKADVVALIAAHDACSLISCTCSCAHTGHFHSKSQWHCGACSQCIDRRFAIVASGLEEHDPTTDYKTDVFIGARAEGYETNMAVDFARHGIEMHRMGEDEIASRFNPELSRAIRHVANRREAAKALVRIHKQHGAIVAHILMKQLHKYAADILQGTLPPTSMLALVAGQKHIPSAWRRFGDRLAGLLELGIPKRLFD